MGASKERDWGSERYARLYLRDTPNWIMMPWQGRALLALLMRKLDRDGRVPMGAYGVAGLAQLVGLPVEVTQAGFDALTAGDDPTLVVEGNTVFMPKFEAAQEMRSSAAKRTAKWRAKQAAQASGVTVGVTGDAPSDVSGTSCDAKVTPSVPSVPSISREAFEVVWAIYPRKVGKGESFKKVQKAVKPSELSDLQRAVEAYAALVKREQREPKYVRHFKTFLANWRDNLEAEAPDEYGARVADLMERA